MSKILVTPRSLTKGGHPALEILTGAGHELIFCTPGQQPCENELVTLLGDCEGYLAGVEKVTARVLDAANNLKAISRNGTGINNIDLEKANEKGIKICRAEGANARGVAELAWAHLLGLLRAVPSSDLFLKHDGWDRRKGIELEGRTLGLVGCGRIGKYVAQFALGFDMRVRAYDPYPDQYFRPSSRFSYAKFDQVLAQADVISLHCPPPPNGHPLIDQTTIGMMKQGVYLLNTARGELLDDMAVYKALENGKIAGVGLDAFREEPPIDRLLLKHGRVIATPHVGGFTKESVDRAVSVAAQNLLEALQ